MMYLADTHIALWLVQDEKGMSEKLLSLIDNPHGNWYVSNVSVWEIAIKHAKHPDIMPVSAKQFHQDCIQSGMKDVYLSLEHIYRTELLPFESGHGDPFDRMLLTQAKYEDMLLVTHDKRFAIYDDPHVLMV